jgi:hypothetical protein
MNMQYAFVQDGEVARDKDGHPVLSVPDKPDRSRPYNWTTGEWLPIEDRDEQPFRLGVHWRSRPRYFVEGDKVVRLYPVVPVTGERQ